MKKYSLAGRLTLCSLLTAAAFVLAWLENLIPFPMPLPGMKLGLANIVSLFAVYSLTLGEASAIVLTRCLLAALLFGGPTQLLFSLSGGLFSLLIMKLLTNKKSITAYGVSMAGAAAHNTAQTLTAILLLSTPSLRLYLMWLYPVSILMGLVTGLIYNLFSRRVQKIFSLRR